MKKSIAMILDTIVVLVAIYFLMSCKPFEITTASYGFSVQEETEDITIAFPLVGKKNSHAYNTFCKPEGTNTGYVKIVYITEEEYNLIMNPQNLVAKKK